MEDVEGITWNSNTKDELRYKHLTNFLHMFILFVGYTCHFYNIQYSIPKGSAKDRVFMMHITKCILDTGWGREPSTIKNHIL